MRVTPVTPLRRLRGAARSRRRRDDRVNQAGGVYALTVLAPILRDRVDELRAYLEARPRLFDALPTTHFARFVIIEAFPPEGPPTQRDRLRSPHLLFSSTFDGGLEEYLDALCSRLPDEAQAIWGSCVGFEGSVRSSPAALKRYLRRNQLQAGLFFNSYPEASAERIRAAIELRARMQDFLLRAQRLAGNELADEFFAEFPSCGEKAT
jgi:hypothetical protein